MRHTWIQSVNNVTLFVERDLIIRVGGVYVSVLELFRKRKFRTFLHLTQVSKIFMMSRLSDFVVCSTNLLFGVVRSIFKV